MRPYCKKLLSTSTSENQKQNLCTGSEMRKAQIGSKIRKGIAQTGSKFWKAQFDKKDSNRLEGLKPNLRAQDICEPKEKSMKKEIDH